MGRLYQSEGSETLMAGRPKAKIDAEQVVSLAKLGATVKEIADFFHVSDATINNRFQNELYEGRAQLKISLRKAQIQGALAGNATLLIWLGKNLLGQQETPTVVATNDDDFGKQAFVHEIKKIIKKPDPQAA